MPPRPFPFPSLQVGTDICSVKRIYKLLTKDNGKHAGRFMSKVLVDQERKDAKLKYAGLALRLGDQRDGTGAGNAQIAGTTSGANILVPGSNSMPKEPHAEMMRAAEYLAGRFAAKEAAIKAHRNRRLTFQDIWIRKQDPKNGLTQAPETLIIGEDGTWDNAQVVPMSISHDQEFATAVCMVVDDPISNVTFKEVTAAEMSTSSVAASPAEEVRQEIELQRELDAKDRTPYVTSAKLLQDADASQLGPSTAPKVLLELLREDKMFGKKERLSSMPAGDSEIREKMAKISAEDGKKHARKVATYEAAVERLKLIESLQRDLRKDLSELKERDGDFLDKYKSKKIESGRKDHGYPPTYDGVQEHLLTEVGKIKNESSRQSYKIKTYRSTSTLPQAKKHIKIMDFHISEKEEDKTTIVHREQPVVGDEQKDHVPKSREPRSKNRKDRFTEFANIRKNDAPSISGVFTSLVSKSKTRVASRDHPPNLIKYHGKQSPENRMVSLGSSETSTTSAFVDPAFESSQSRLRRSVIKSHQARSRSLLYIEGLDKCSSEELNASLLTIYPNGLLETFIYKSDTGEYLGRGAAMYESELHGERARRRLDSVKVCGRRVLASHFQYLPSNGAILGKVDERRSLYLTPPSVEDDEISPSLLTNRDCGVYIRNVPLSISREQLAEVFSGCEEVRYMGTTSGMHQGRVMVVMSTPELAQTMRMQKRGQLLRGIPMDIAMGPPEPGVILAIPLPSWVAKAL
ncbi:hypothetical protein B0O99DRAFT_688728 [Bisporella sp. PMI_857]|nr:hypothetical protein B0O99DRAFT_688728 [Bisporella sp. PMI_857]